MGKVSGLIVAAVAAIGAGAWAQSAGPLTTVRIGHLPIPGQVLFYIAQAEGYFKAEGLDVQLTPISASADVMNALAAGKFDFAAAGTAAPLNFIAKGAPFLIVGGLLEEGSVFQVRSDAIAQIKTIQDFKGKKIGTVRLGTGDVVLRGELAKAGILKEVEFVEFKSPVDSLLALKTGRVDIALTWPPYSTQGEQDGTVKSVAWTGQWFPGHTCCRLVTTTEYAAKNPGVVVKVLKSLIRAEQFFKANPEKSVQEAAGYLKISPDLVRPTLVTEKTSHISSAPNKPQVLRFWENMKAAGYATSNVDIAAHIDESYYRKALAELKN